MELKDSPETLQALRKPQVTALKNLRVFNLQDLLLYFPFRYLDFSKNKKINELTLGENVTLKVVIKSIGSRFSFRGRLSLAEAIVSDSTGSLKVVWFNQSYLAKTLSVGEEIFLAGAVENYKGTLQLSNPIYEKVSDPPATPEVKANWQANIPIHTSRLVPVYRLSSGIYLKTLRNLIAKALNIVNLVPESLPASILFNQKLLSIQETIKRAHFPESLEQKDQVLKRLAFEEIFLNQLAAQKHKILLSKKQSLKAPFKQKLVQAFVKSLPFALTAEQKKATWEILQDLEKPMPMNRLLEGDVGSGKTLVALIAALQCLEHGFQVVFLCPTEILAKQHFETALKYFKFKNSKFGISLLTNSYSRLSEAELSKTEALKAISSGLPGLYIGTHALLQKNVKFKKLALVIIDEQHRFGVEQRAFLFQAKNKKVPHLLSLSATPIPRTLQLAFYGELEISQIKTKPKDRKPIITKLVEEQNRAQAYEFIKNQVKTGRQVFIITPLIEENAKEKKAAETEILALKKIFPEFKIGMLHGKLKSLEKEKVMREFLENQIQILVSTSVVEVGVDVPNASVMLIEGADHFGLSQLHQFRGRVGRSSHQSFCFLFSQNLNEETKKRLVGFTKTQDGFELSELDLKTRGFGDVYGQQQSGWNFKYFNPNYISLIKPAREEAIKMLQEDFELENYPQLKEKISQKTIHFE